MNSPKNSRREYQSRAAGRLKMDTVRDAHVRVYEYIEKSPPELRTMCREVWEESLKIRALEEFATLPTFFCPDLDIGHNRALMLSQMYIYLTLFFRIQDCAIDERDAQHTRRILCGNIFLGQLMKLLRRFPPEIFDVVEKTLLEYSEASALEITKYSFNRHNPVPAGFSFDDISFLGKKFSPLKIPLAAAILHAGTGSLTDVNALFDTYGTALQIRNDIIDWREDYERGQMTYFLSELLCYFGELESWPEMEEMNRIFVFSPAVENMLRIELNYTKKTAEISRNISQNLHNFFEKRVRTLHEDISALRKWRKNLTKA